MTMVLGAGGWGRRIGGVLSTLRPFNKLTTSPPRRIHTVPLVLPNRRLTPRAERFAGKRLSRSGPRPTIRNTIREVACMIPHGSRAPRAEPLAVTRPEFDDRQPNSQEPRDRRDPGESP